LKSIQTVKVGMTRSDLMKVSTTEGGLEFKSETTAQRTYIYRGCPYIKVDVKMAISGPDRDLPTDYNYRNLSALSRLVNHGLSTADGRTLVAGRTDGPAIPRAARVPISRVCEPERRERKDVCG
jgi:hypothetical protein